jgi:hypothetical protein
LKALAMFVLIRGSGEFHPHSRRSDSADFVEAAAAVPSPARDGDSVPSCCRLHGGQPRPKGFLAETWQLVQAIGRAMRITAVSFIRKPVTVTIRTSRARIRTVIAGCSRSSTRRTPAKRASGAGSASSCVPGRHCGRDAQGEAGYAKTFTLELYACEFCELCVGVPDGRDRHDEVVRHVVDRRDMLLDKDGARHRRTVPAVVGDG